MDLALRNHELSSPPIRELLVKDGLVFISASAVAAGLNYLFQVFASRQLSPLEFANMSGWIANLTPIFFAATLLQYQANFRPTATEKLRIFGVVGSMMAIPALWFWWKFENPMGLASSLTIGVFTAFMTWQMGQLQIRIRFLALSVVGLVIAGTRVVATQWPGLTTYDLHLFIFANLISSAVTIWLLTILLWSKVDASHDKTKEFWRRAFLLSLAGAVIPQFDMLLMNYTQEKSVFVTFAQSSLFGRAVYAMTTILATWLLPHQIRGQKLTSPIPLSVILAILFLGAGAIAGLSPYISTYVFGWSDPPSRALVFLASAELSLLAVFFVKIQSACARIRLREAGIYLGVLAVEALLQFTFRLPAETFLTMALAAQTLTILGVWRSDK